MTPEQHEKQKMWGILARKGWRPNADDFEQYYQRNPPRELRPVWQKIVILSVPVMVLAGVVGLML